MAQETGRGAATDRDGGSRDGGTRAIAIVGPYLAGKTTLLEAILARTGTIAQQGRVQDGTTKGDASPEARAHGMSVALNVFDTNYLGGDYTFIDCPGSVEFLADGASALTICDAAVVVCEPDAKRVPALQLILRQLEERGIPHFLFLNKIDSCRLQVRDIIPMLQPASERPLVLRQVPIWENGIATGFVDLASERAYVYREHAPSEIVELPAGIKGREEEARFHMLEQLADYDDDLMEQLLADMIPPLDKIFEDLTAELREGAICPVLIGSAEHGNGIGRLLKALRHEVPDAATTAERIGLEPGAATAFVFKTVHSPHGGKISFARVFGDTLADGAIVRSSSGAEERISGVLAIHGEEYLKRGAARPGDVVGLGRLDGIATGETAIGGKRAAAQAVACPPPPEPVYVTGLAIKDRKDEVKLTSALAKLCEEDPSLEAENSIDTHQLLLKGQGEMHLRVALERLQRKFAISVERQPRLIPYKETIRKSAEVRGRHKKQSGGHGQFGDVVIAIRPQPRGVGFAFDEVITGGVVPKQFFPSVEHGARDYLNKGPLGFPVVDVAVTLKDGSVHSVDSSDMAFRAATRLAMSEGMPQCAPVLLEPIMAVSIMVPSDATARINGIIPQRRGQILGFDARHGWPGWDVIEAHIPDSEIEDLIIELRSATAGVGTYTARFDHLAELTGKLADQVVSGHAEAAE
ncbi:MAG: elongation factor G [Alphaproteobacteria bacterium BRH_c36]|nr:MAG: elongation factor G [Alphaproteobacteria bacterium BRH_c36]